MGARGNRLSESMTRLGRQSHHHGMRNRVMHSRAKRAYAILAIAAAVVEQ